MDKIKYIKLEQEDGSYSDAIPLAVDGSYIDINGNTLIDELSKKAEKDDINILSDKINGLVDGTPLVAASLSDMIDTSKIYVLTTDGNWYYYTNSSWVAGGIYEATINTDVSQDIENIAYNNYTVEDNLSQTTTIIVGSGITIATGATANNTKRARTNRNATTKIKMVILDGETYLMRPFFYTQQTGDWGPSFVSTSQDWGKKFYLGANTNLFFALSFKRVDEAVWTDQDTINLRANLHYYKTTDSTLTLSNSPADAKIVGDKINLQETNLKNIYRYVDRDWIEDICEWTIGSTISLTTGGILNNYPNRCKTWRFNRVKAGRVLLTDPTYQFRCVYYNSIAGAWEADYANAYEDWATEIFTNSNYPYCAFAFKRADNENLTNIDLANIKNAFNIYQLTDTSLSTRFISADAKTVGDKFNNRDRINYKVDNIDFVQNECTFSVGRTIGTGGASYSDNERRICTLRGLSSEIRGRYIILDTSDYQMSLRFFTAYSSTDITQYYDGYSDWCNEYFLENYPYYGLVFKRSDNEPVTDEDVDNIKAALHIYKKVDTSLSIAAAPADAKAVGDKFLNDEILYYTAPLSMYRKIGFCGDSRTSGFYYWTNTSDPIENRELSWGANLARRNGCEYGIYAREGRTTKQFLSDSNCLPKLLNDTPCNLYFLCLGGNDSSKGGLDYLGTIDDITEDYHNNPDTFYGNYARIIEQIKEHSPNCKFIMAMFHYYKSVHSTTGNRQKFWEATREIAQYYGIPFLDWTNDPWYQSDDFINGIRHNHPSVVQYAGIAQSAERLYSALTKQYYTYFIKYTE